MPLSTPDEDSAFVAMNQVTISHEKLLEENKVKIDILTQYLMEKLENIGHGNIWIGLYFPNEVMFEDLKGLLDTQETEIRKIGERYFDTICQKFGIK